MFREMCITRAPTTGTARACKTGSRVLTTEFALPQNLPAGTYSLVVTAVGNPSAPQTFTYAPPPVPTGLSAASGSNAFVNLDWNASAGATAYNVKRASTSRRIFRHDSDRQRHVFHQYRADQWADLLLQSRRHWQRRAKQRFGRGQRHARWPAADSGRHTVSLARIL